MVLLATYKHDSELQVITTPMIISKIHNSPQHQLSFFQPAVSSAVVPWQRLRTVEIPQPHLLRSSLHGLPYRTVLVITSRQGSHRKHRSFIVAFVSVAAGMCLPSCCPETTAARITENTALLFLLSCMLRTLPIKGLCL
jgi:hypothetical protein